MDEKNPYAPGDVPNPEAPARGRISQRRAAEAEGSFGLGVVIGVLFGLWGALGCWLLAKPETARGAKIGFLGRLLVTLVLVAIVMLLAPPR